MNTSLSHRPNPEGVTCDGAVQGVVQQFAGHVQLEVEAGRDAAHHLLLDVGQDARQQELSPGGYKQQSSPSPLTKDKGGAKVSETRLAIRRLTSARSNYHRWLTLHTCLIKENSGSFLGGLSLNCCLMLSDNVSRLLQTVAGNTEDRDLSLIDINILGM